MNFFNMFSKKSEKQNGQTLIEALIALGAAVLVLSAITVAVISATNNVEYTKNQNLATQYAQQGVEIMRQVSQSNWATFSLYNGRYCLAKDDTAPCLLGTLSGSCSQSSQTSCGQNYGIFVREIDVAQGSQTTCVSGSIGITAIISWADGKCHDSANTYCHNVELSSCVSNHNSEVTAP
jgi:Tfp pilus assembly protein PilV